MGKVVSSRGLCRPWAVNSSCSLFPSRMLAIHVDRELLDTVAQFLMRGDSNHAMRWNWSFDNQGPSKWTQRKNIQWIPHPESCITMQYVKGSSVWYLGILSLVRCKSDLCEPICAPIVTAPYSEKKPGNNVDGLRIWLLGAPEIGDSEKSERERDESIVCRMGTYLAYWNTLV